MVLNSLFPHKTYQQKSSLPNHGLLLRVLQQSLIEITFSMNIIEIHLILPSQIFELRVLGTNTPQIRPKPTMPIYLNYASKLRT